MAINRQVMDLARERLFVITQNSLATSSAIS